MIFHHKVSGLSNVQSYRTYNHTFDNHLIEWMKEKFDLTIGQDCNYNFVAHIGDYDLDIKTASGDTVMDAAMTYGAYWDGELFDKLEKIWLGE